MHARRLACVSRLRLGGYPKTCAAICSLRVLGTFSQFDWGKDQEYSDVLKAGWKAHHAERYLWRTKGLPVQKTRALHLSVFPVLTLCAGTRGCTLAELKGFKTIRCAWPARRAVGRQGY